MGQMINVTVSRQTGDDQSAENLSYEVPYEEGMTVLMALEYLYQNYTVAYRHSCDIGLCTICMMRINGKPKMACKEILNEPQDLVIEPSRNHPVLRDLACDFDKKQKG